VSPPVVVEELVAGESSIQDAVNLTDIQNDLVIQTATSPKVMPNLSSDNAVASLPSKVVGMPVSSSISNLNNTLNANVSIVDTPHQSPQGLQCDEPQVESNGNYAEQVRQVTVL
jgi:hypothetical protein